MSSISSFNEPEVRESVRSLLDTSSSAVMQKTASTIERVSVSDLSIVIVGENGTGKERIARMIHQMSARANRRFVTVSCTALSPEDSDKEIFGYEKTTREDVEIKRGAIEESAGGTIYFDEIADLPPVTQKRIGQALERHLIRRVGGSKDLSVNVRFIAGLNRKPDAMVEEGILRKEMYDHISPIIIDLPPLRERREDIPLLIEQFLMQLNCHHASTVEAISPEVLSVCHSYHWPGNIKQLKNAIEYAVVTCRGPLLQREHLPLYLRERRPYSPQGIVLQENISMASAEKLLIERALQQSRTKKEAATLLGISLKTLYNKVNRYNLYEKFVNDSRIRKLEREKKR